MCLNTGARSRLLRPRVQGISSGPWRRTHYCPTDSVHYTWDVANEPLLTIADGDTVVFETRDVSDNQIGPGSDSSVIPNIDWDRVYPLAGPVFVEGAEPGDTLAIEIVDLHTARLGLDGDPPGPRPAGRRLHRALPARLRPVAGRPHRLPRGHHRPALAVHGHDGRLPLGRQRGPGHAAVRGSAATSTPASSSRARRCTCPSASRARSSRPATPTAARATARSASRALRPRCTPSCASRWRRTARSPRPSTAPPPAR